MEEPSIVAVGVVWNHRDRLPLLLRSLDEQTRRPEQTVLVDAASHDGVSTWLAQAYPYISTLRLFQHRGLGHAWRQAAKFALQRVAPEAQSRTWLLFVTPETLLAKDVCAQLLKEVVAHPEIGAVGPAILRAWYQGEGEDGLEQIEPTELVESLGMQPLRSFAWMHRGRGESLRMHEPIATEVFAPSSTVAMYRADHVEKLLHLEAFSLAWKTVDAMFLDLAWRLHWLGMKTYVLPDVLAWRVEHKNNRGEHARTWLECLAIENDRRLLVRGHLVGGWPRMRTLLPRMWATIRSWPYRAWRLVGKADRQPASEALLMRVGQRLLETHRVEALETLNKWILGRP
ncbi:glycosyltransferase family 2 protein [Patescibacteria group bacterium]|nr:glycosyltransferase family 2 protein [Patescibacteria group bacterium]